MASSKRIRIGGDLDVSRLGYGAMRLTGQPGNFGPYVDWEGGKALVRRAADLGVDFFDTALPYGPGHGERLLAEALGDRSVVIATKGGVDKPEPGEIVTDGRPETLRAHVERSLHSLDRDVIDLYQLHRVDPEVPLPESIGALETLRQEGKLRHLGLSNVTLEQYEAARVEAPIATVQNRFNIVERSSLPLLRAVERDGGAFLPYGPLGANPMRPGAPLAADESPIAAIAAELDQAPVAVALAWLLHVSPCVVAIPATTTERHLEENVAALHLELSDAQLARLEAVEQAMPG